MGAVLLLDCHILGQGPCPCWVDLKQKGMRGGVGRHQASYRNYRNLSVQRM